MIVLPVFRRIRGLGACESSSVILLHCSYFIKKPKLLAKVKIQNTNAIFFFTLRFDSIFISSSKDQVFRPISLILPCKCREFLTLLHIIEKLSNHMLYNYMFSFFWKWTQATAFSQEKTFTKQTQQTNPLMYSTMIFSFLHFRSEWVSFTYFFLLSVLYTNIGE